MRPGEFTELIDSAYAVAIDDDVLVYPSTSEVTGDPENEILYLSWEIDGLEYSVRVCEETVRDTARIERGEDGVDRLVFKDEDESDIRLTLLQPKELKEN